MKKGFTFPERKHEKGFTLLERKHEKGFTLLEILVVISIIGILVAIGATSYTTAQKKGRDARRKGDLNAIQRALEQYYSNSSSYPGGTFPNGISSYMPQGVPTDPKSSSNYCVSAYTTSSYTICCDLEGTGGWSATSCTNNDFCVYASQ